jgi:hypothetical protein
MPRDDVDKRPDRTEAFRAAARYVSLVVVVAGVVFAAYAFAARESVVAASAVPLVLLFGGVGAFVRTYREWKANGAWVIWQGAGWLLLMLMLVALGVPGAAVMSGAVR